MNSSMCAELVFSEWNEKFKDHRNCAESKHFSGLTRLGKQTREIECLLGNKLHFLQQESRYCPSMLVQLAARWRRHQCSLLNEILKIDITQKKLLWFTETKRTRF